MWIEFGEDLVNLDRSAKFQKHYRDCTILHYLEHQILYSCLFRTEKERAEYWEHLKKCLCVVEPENLIKKLNVSDLVNSKTEDIQ